MIKGYATAEGTAAYRARVGAAAAPGHFRDWAGLALSSVGLGTYLGAEDAATDRAYEEAVTRAVGLGLNVLDSAVNYRGQRSERAIGAALRAMAAAGRFARAEVILASKGGFIPADSGDAASRSGAQGLYPVGHRRARRHRGRLPLHDPALSRRPARAQPRESRRGDPGRLLPPQSGDAAAGGGPSRRFSRGSAPPSSSWRGRWRRGRSAGTARRRGRGSARSPPPPTISRSPSSSGWRPRWRARAITSACSSFPTTWA